MVLPEVMFPVLTVSGLPDPYRYDLAHRALPKLTFQMTESLFDLMGGRPVHGLSWNSVMAIMVVIAQRESNTEADPDYIFAPAHPLAVEGWEAYWLALPDPAGVTEACGMVVARRRDLPRVPRVFAVEPSGGEAALAEWRYDCRIRYRSFEPSESGLIAFLSKILAGGPHPPPRGATPILGLPPAPDPAWWAEQPLPKGATKGATSNSDARAPATEEGGTVGAAMILLVLAGLGILLGWGAWDYLNPWDPDPKIPETWWGAIFSLLVGATSLGLVSFGVLGLISLIPWPSGRR